MRVKKNTIKKMIRKQMMRNYLHRDYLPEAVNTSALFAGLRADRSRLRDDNESRAWVSNHNYHVTRKWLFSIEPGFIGLSKVEYDAKFTAAIRNRMPEILRDTADNLAARILEQLPDGYWKP